MNEKILIVDDVSVNRRLLASILKRNTSYEIIISKSGIDVVEMLEKSPDYLPDLILLDVMMPKMSGFELAEILKNNKNTSKIPIIFVTGLSETENILKAFEMGGVDYITKPFNQDELLARVNNYLKLKSALKELEVKNKLLVNKETHLTYLVEEKTKKIDDMTVAIISTLENANLYNDNVTGKHLKRVSEYSAILAVEYGCDFDFVKKIKIYSRLHDIGKVGISDKLLKKKGKYTPNEYDGMKKHVIIGAKMLENPVYDIMAKNIANFHHEKWDGSGYCLGLKGEEIPLEARIVALADVFDALTTERTYKKAFSQEETESIIIKGKGKHFDPKIVDVFFRCVDKILNIEKEFN